MLLYACLEKFCEQLVQSQDLTFVCNNIILIAQQEIQELKKRNEVLEEQGNFYEDTVDSG